MSLSNPAGAAGAAAAAYTEAILGLLGDRDPMEVMAETAGVVRAHLADLADADLRRPEAPGKWSIAAVVRHLADTEVVWAYRFRMVASEDDAAIAGFDQDAWASGLRYMDADPHAALDVFATLRADSLSVLAALPPGAADRVGVHAERGTATLGHMIRFQAGHDMAHRRQIDRIREGMRGGG